MTIDEDALRKAQEELKKQVENKTVEDLIKEDPKDK